MRPDVISGNRNSPRAESARAILCAHAQKIEGLAKELAARLVRAIDREAVVEQLARGRRFTFVLGRQTNKSVAYAHSEWAVAHASLGHCYHESAAAVDAADCDLEQLMDRDCRLLHLMALQEATLRLRQIHMHNLVRVGDDCPPPETETVVAFIGNLSLIAAGLRVCAATAETDRQTHTNGAHIDRERANGEARAQS